MAQTTTSPAFFDHFSAIEDPRQQWKVLYSLEEILLLVLCGVLAGADDFVEIAKWGKTNLKFLHRFLKFENGIPSHDAINDLFNAIDADLFSNCFISWVNTLRSGDVDTIAIDGKTSRRSGDKPKDKNPLHMVSAWASQQKLVLGQQACEEKSNEITAIPALLEKLALQGALVTIDAMGCQKSIARKIINCGGDYLLGLKGNQPTLYESVRTLFDNPPQNMEVDYLEIDEAGHGRKEKRRHFIFCDIDNLEDQEKWPGLSSIGCVESEVERNGKIECARRYYISSFKFDASRFASAVRAHWGIENRLHWVLDVIFHDDLSRLRSGHGPHNMAVIRHMAVNLIRSAKDKDSQKVRRKTAAWSTDYLEMLLVGTA